jgi:hypothetical protein
MILLSALFKFALSPPRLMEASVISFFVFASNSVHKNNLQFPTKLINSLSLNKNSIEILSGLILIE